ncbi:MAG TPA: DUF5924 family protein [Kofleriaceae bacterium]|jgi:hypothetical protein|nr:DUF5924 family protein [Kofleriaceae bacterium]
MASPEASPDERPGDRSVDRSGAPPPSRLRRLLRRLWWVHSFFALSFGAGVMLFARAGLAHADKIMIALFVSWLILFIALRFIVGPANRRDQETIARRGVRVATNYLIKQFYQQMFFFLTPLYASSATWSLASWNWWLAPLLLVCAVVSTLDLVFDHFVMERRLLASAMYGLAMFGVLNVLLPLVAGLDHRAGLVIAAAATPISVALLSFSLGQVMSLQGVLLVIVATGGLTAAVWYGRAFVPPAPLTMLETAVGHGTIGSYECLPGSKHQIRANQIDGLRCGAMLREPGGLKEEVIQIWTWRGRELLHVTPEHMHCNDGDGEVFRSMFPLGEMPADPTGRWTCTTMTTGGQLVGVRRFEIVTADGKPGGTSPEEAAPGDAGVDRAGADAAGGEAGSDAAGGDAVGGDAPANASVHEAKDAGT